MPCKTCLRLTDLVFAEWDSNPLAHYMKIYSYVIAFLLPNLSLAHRKCLKKSEAIYLVPTMLYLVIKIFADWPVALGLLSTFSVKCQAAPFEFNS